MFRFFSGGRVQPLRRHARAQAGIRVLLAVRLLNKSLSGFNLTNKCLRVLGPRLRGDDGYGERVFDGNAIALFEFFPIECVRSETAVFTQHDDQRSVSFSSMRRLRLNASSVRSGSIG